MYIDWGTFNRCQLKSGRDKSCHTRREILFYHHQKNMMQIRQFLRGSKPTLLMLVVQFAYAAVNVFYTLSTSEGMSPNVIVAYRYIFATVFMVPLAIVSERGSLNQNLYVKSLSLSSATLASTMFNLVPAVTFVLAICFRLEKAGIGTLAGKAKVIGTVIGIGGAMVLTLYKGPEIKMLSTHIDLLKHIHTHGKEVHHLTPSHASQVLGCLLALASCFSFALWLIVQAKMIAAYPYPYSCTALMTITAAIQSTVFALCVEKDWSQWKLGWDVRLLTVAYAGIVASGLMVFVTSWCVRMRGPLFVSAFNPLMTLLVALAESEFLQEKLHLGSVLGAALIVFGLYGVLWGKGKEIKKVSQPSPIKSTEESETMNKTGVTSPTSISGAHKTDVDLSIENLEINAPSSGQASSICQNHQVNDPEMRMKFSDWLHDLKPTLIMVVVHIATAGIQVLYKLVASDGMNPGILIAYRYSIGSAFMVPLALVLERDGWAKITWMVVLLGFFSGFLGGSLCQILSVKAISLSSATLVATMFNLVPAVTFIFAISFGLERARVGTLAGKAKGTVVSGLVIILTSWCVRMRGPLFVSVFNPLMALIVAIAGSTLLDEKLHLGSIIGGILIVCGLYTALWGKGKEINKTTQLYPSTIINTDATASGAKNHEEISTTDGDLRDILAHGNQSNRDAV
ncbi:hypothetical protein Tsubulata_018023 [Turnera subulata]|uniref:EamA domain-containing protein n=1 Tax=Turnera subulata TaxID=218843 RepID=A0A9Q0GBW9_9ROSI|nr:hypothetical protein Tsubulata_018023 [Turnera subulata]